MVAEPIDLAVDQSILQALHGLKEADQELLRLVAWEAMPHNQIAQVLGCSENAVAIRLHRARQRLAQQLAGNDATNLKGARVPRHIASDGAKTNEGGSNE